MAKTFDQPKREAIIICPQHGRLETRPEPGYVKDKEGNSHFFHLAYCSQCGTFYTTYRTLTDIWEAPRFKGVPIRTVDTVSPHEAKRLDDARKAAAAAARRREEQRIRAAAESRAEREEWTEFFAPKESDFAALYAESMGQRPSAAKKPKPAAAAKPQAGPQPKADPYAKAEPLSVEAVTLTRGTLKQCPADGGALASAAAWLEMKDGKRKKLAGGHCPVCGAFYANRRSFECLKLAAEDLITEMREGE